MPTSTPSPKPSPNRTPAPTQAPPSIGKDRASAIPVGTPGTVGDWTVIVTNVVPDGTAAVLAWNYLNPKPAGGRQFFLVAISATYNGSKEPAQSWPLSFKTVGAANLAYGHQGSDYCGSFEDALNDFKDVFKGGTLVGKLCWSVKSDDVSTLTMYAQDTLSVGSRTVWFSLQPK